MASSYNFSIAAFNTSYKYLLFLEEIDTDYTSLGSPPDSDHRFQNSTHKALEPAASLSWRTWGMGV